MLNINEEVQPASCTPCDSRVAMLLDGADHLIVVIDHVLEQNERVMAEVRG